MTLWELDEQLVRRYSNLRSGNSHRHARVMVEACIGRCVHVQRVEANCSCCGNLEGHSLGPGPTGNDECWWVEAWISYLWGNVDWLQFDCSDETVFGSNGDRCGSSHTLSQDEVIR